MLLKRLLSGLTDKQREILTARYGFNGRVGKITLAALGGKYGITRERVRQIEVAALKSAAEAVNRDEEAKKVVADAVSYLRSLGGVEITDRFSLRFPGAAAFILKVNGAVFHRDEDGEFHAFWHTDKNAMVRTRNFLKKLEVSLKDNKNEVIDKGKFGVLFAAAAKAHGLSEAVGLNYVSISKRFGVNPYGDIGLSEWPEIYPKTVKEKAHIVLKKIVKPMHFSEIAEEINKMNFNSKKAYAQTVHNELIKDERFVLVGRGMYGLAEYGHKPGIAKEVIRRILKEKGPMRANDVLLAVQSERFFKPNTVFLNLQNKNFFERTSDGKYRVKEV
ncbi:MAG: hypothetical protein UX23_C0004G0038 [Parcubacteria group bacterium GW2011_GWB1_45_9]|nr:MAG: hypothetical protein UX23_C0004G0038 [Parcubacteria group bacterium GW2011_GWB1_45_9]